MSTQTTPPAPRYASDPPVENRTFAKGARVLSIGIASTGLFTFAYLATASHILSKSAYSRISLCWSIMFVILSVIYRPIEQLLSRTIADRHARGISAASTLRTPALIQGTFATGFLIVALALHHVIQHDLFDGSSGLYTVLLVGVLAYAASYFARGWLAGNRRFALYGGLVFLESTSRLLFALAAAIGISHGQNAVAAGMAAAPFVSLCVIPFAFTRVRGRGLSEAVPDKQTATELSLRHGSRFAGSVVAIMLSEQALLNAGVIVVAANSRFDLTTGITGFVFNVLLIVRAPLQLFQAVQTSILPHLTGMEARESAQEFRNTIRRTTQITFGFGVAVALGLLAVGPEVMKLAVGDHGFTYDRVGLAAVGLGMGFHLTAGTFNQALLARQRAGLAATAWLAAAAAFVLFVALPTIHNEVARTETGYCGATAVLALLLWLLYRTTGSTAIERPAAAQTPRAPEPLPIPAALPAARARPALRPSRTTWVVLGATAVITTVSLLITHAIAYDPQCWIVWAREAVGPGQLSTWDGPTWKPLPILLITPFTLISRGEADVYYWLVFARAGALLGVFGVAAITNRIAGRTAAAIAALLIVVSAWWWYNGILGNAEPMVIGLIAGAVLAHDRGWIPLAGALAWAICLTRPEVCPFALLYAAWLIWQRRAQTRTLLITVTATAIGTVTVLVAWAVPNLLHTGGSTIGSATGKPQAGSSPFLAAFRNTFSELTVVPAILAAIGIIIAVWTFRRAWKQSSLRDALESGQRELLIGVVALIYVAMVGLMAQVGFSGNLRYLIPPLAGLEILAATTAVRLARVIATRLRVTTPRLRDATVVVVVIGCALLVALNTLRTQRLSVSGHAMVASTMRRQLVGFDCTGHVVTFPVNNSTLAQITGQSLAASTKPRSIPSRRGKFIYCDATPTVS